jgi:hypothetical protein
VRFTKKAKTERRGQTRKKKPQAGQKKEQFLLKKVSNHQQNTNKIP